VQVCTSLQTDNHTSTSPLSFLQAGCPSCRPTNSVKALKALYKSVYYYYRYLLSNPSALVDVSKGMPSANHCTNKILQFLTGSAG